VIVVWTENAARSAFVRDEASRAQAEHKLVSTCADGFDTKTLPLGFGSLHCHPVSAIDKTVKAISKLQAVPAESKTALERAHLLAEEAFWSAIENSTDPKDFEIYLDEYKNGVHRALARLKLSRLKPGTHHFKRPSAGGIGPSGLALFVIWTLVTSVALIGLGSIILQSWAVVFAGRNYWAHWAIVSLSLLYVIASILFLDYAFRRRKA
jgi:hypothetical protein